MTDRSGTLHHCLAFYQRLVDLQPAAGLDSVRKQWLATVIVFAKLDTNSQCFFSYQRQEDLDSKLKVRQVTQLASIHTAFADSKHLQQELDCRQMVTASLIVAVTRLTVSVAFVSGVFADLTAYACAFFHCL